MIEGLPSLFLERNFQFKTGDFITTTSDVTPLILHRGIVVVEDDGKAYVYHNSPSEVNELGGSIIKESLDVWLKNRKIKSIEPTRLTKDKIEQMYLTFNTRKFNLFSFNCEQFAYFVKEGELKSPQLAWWGVIAVLGGIALGVWIYNKKKK